MSAVGCRIIEGNGSRVPDSKRDAEVESFHRPHPAKEAKRYQVRAARAFLIRLGDRAMTNVMTYKAYAGRSNMTTKTASCSARSPVFATASASMPTTLKNCGCLPRGRGRLSRDLCQDRQGTPEAVFGQDDVPRRPEIHRKAASWRRSFQAGKSLNQWAEEA